MYQVGELIIYGGTGVCEVADIVMGDHVGASRSLDENRLYYVLKPVHETGTIYVPTDSTNVPTRPVITKEEADRLIDMIPKIKAEAYQDSGMQDLKNHYQTATQTTDCADLIELTMSIYTKKQDAEQQKRKLGQMDERFMKRAEDMLYGEFSVALNLEKDQVPEYIAARLEAAASKTKG